MKNIIQEAILFMENQYKLEPVKFNGSNPCKDYLRLQLAEEKEEVFAAMFLTNQFQLLGFEKLFRGSITEASIYPRPIIRKIFEYNAAKIVIAHNHPSGECKPSNNDNLITERLYKLFKEIDCTLVDHIIVSPVETFSYAEKNFFNFYIGVNHHA